MRTIDHFALELELHVDFGLQGLVVLYFESWSLYRGLCSSLSQRIFPKQAAARSG